MSEETKTEQQEEQVTTEQETEHELSNKDVKSHPLFQKLTEQLGEFNRKEAERAEAEEKAARDAAMEQARKEQKWEELVKLREQELEETKAKYEKDMLTKDLKTEMVRAGFQNEIFLNGAIASYSGDPDGVAEYVEQLKSDEANAVFLASGQQEPARMTPPSSPKVTGTKLSDARLTAMESSSDPAERKQAREYLERLIKQGSNLPPK